MDQSRFSEKFLTILLLVLFFGVALYLRIYFPYEQVFSGEWVKFSGNDSYYHMRLVDNLLRHFPEFLAFDPYTLYPIDGEPWLAYPAHR
jgi:dolichyl-diphosphooligosaccharide--protein glycosyltransferase